jgi:signal transduction histidine kinase
MRVRVPHIFDSLHVRVTGLFLLLLLVSGGAWYLWVKGTALEPRQDPATAHWWDDLADGEIADLGARCTPVLDDPTALADLLAAFGDRVRRYEAEVAVVDAAGRVVASSDADSLGAAIGSLDPALIAAMANEDWNFGSYPDSTSVDAYVNRIFQVEPLAAAAGGRPAGWLVASYMPLTVTPDELVATTRHMGAQAVIVALLAGALSGVISMTWLSRRIHALSAGVEAYAGGDLARRVPATSADDLGRLGRNVNLMAARLETLIEDLRGKELFQRQLITNISHDLRSPMAALRGYVETFVIRGAEMSDDERQRHLEIITGNLDHLDRLVDHLLQLSRLDAGQARFQMEDFPLPELVDGVITRCEGIARKKGVTLDAVIPDDLPLVHADPLQIAQVLQNLLDNGIKFNRENGRVVVELVAVPSGVQVTVRDDGEGIAPEILPHIFDRFYAGDASRHRKGESNGLGLAIAQKIVQGHHGTLTVTSRQGEGSAFTFTLAAAETRHAASAKA